jgi:S-formylglutathione hydrolase FrmB
MQRIALGVVGVLTLAFGVESARAGPFTHCELKRINRGLHGQVIDFTHNHGKDNRIWSAALCSRRDLYVYVPPNFDPTRKYPLAIFLHGAAQDERYFLRNIIQNIDQAMADGRLPPCIVAAPDGSILGRQSVVKVATFFANTDAGRYEDYLMIDVWDFLMENFPIHPEREAHALIGASMGGSAAFAQAIKHKDKVKIAVGFMPALNLRWVDCHGKYERPFDPDCWGWRTDLRPLEVIGRPKGCYKVRFHKLFGPEIGHGPDAMAKLSRFNPIEVMDEYDLKPGELDLYVAYGGKDEFNIQAQVESFLFRAKERGITVGVTYDPNGRHDAASARRWFPDVLRWIAPLVEPYSRQQ